MCVRTFSRTGVVRFMDAWREELIGRGAYNLSYPSTGQYIVTIETRQSIRAYILSFKNRGEESTKQFDPTSLETNRVYNRIQLGWPWFLALSFVYLAFTDLSSLFFYPWVITWFPVGFVAFQSGFLFSDVGVSGIHVNAVIIVSLEYGSLFLKKVSIDLGRWTDALSSVIIFQCHRHEYHWNHCCWVWEWMGQVLTSGIPWRWEARSEYVWGAVCQDDSEKRESRRLNVRLRFCEDSIP